MLAIDHTCRGCVRPSTCCCARYEVCVTAGELDRIIQVLPEAARLCPRLKTARGYDNVFDEVESGLYTIDKRADGLCAFAFISDHVIRCALHSAALMLGLPLEKVKPQACLLWPLSSSRDDKLLSLDNEALSFRCISRRRKPARELSPSLMEAVRLVYGKTFSAQLEKAAGKVRLPAKLRSKIRV